MEFRILGPVEVWQRTSWRPVAAAKQRALLALLLLQPGRPVERDRLVDTVWNGSPPASAARLLPHYVWRLRELLPDGDRRLRTSTSGYVLDVAADAVDAGRFAALVADAQTRTRDGQPAAAVDLLAEALRLWHGPALADVRTLPVLDAAAHRLDQRRVAAREALGEALLAAGRPAEAVADLDDLTREEPFREDPWRLLMLALHRTARRTDALAAYRRMRELWTEELGSEPGPALHDLHRRLLADGATPAAPAEPAPAQLPGDPPWFTGRAREVDRILALAAGAGPGPAAEPGPRPAAGPGPRVAAGPGPRPAAVTVGVIHGMAGAGKTTLAAHAAHRLRAGFPDGQLFIDLHGFTAGVDPVPPAEALDRLLRALGVPADHVPAHVEDRAARWRSTLADRRLLLLLDNAADEAQVRPLLPGAPGCLVLVTSRSRLIGLDSTASLSLDVMTLDDARALLRDAAGAARIGGDVDVATEIVELCGRLPLAIRVAAARLAANPAWTPEQLAARLRDRRHRLSELSSGERGVAAAVEVSCRHLDVDTLRLYHRLALHPGADLDEHAAAALAGVPDEPAARMLDALAAVHLLDAHAPGRYRFHDLLRELAAQAVHHDEPADHRRAALTRLFDHYGRTAELAVAARYPHRAPAAGTPADSGWAGAWLDVELANLIASVEHAAVHGWPGPVRRLSRALDHHLRVRGHHAAAEALHERALDVARAEGDRAAEAEALNALGYARRQLGRPAAAEECFARARPLARAVGDRVAELEALQGLGHARRARGAYDDAVACFLECLDIARGIGHLPGQLPALQGLGYTFRIQGQPERAAGYFEQALAVAREIGHRSGELGSLSGLGYLHRALGRLDFAADRFDEALALARVLGHRAAEVGALWGLGQVRHAQRRPADAREHFAAAADLAREIGDRNGLFEAEHGLGLTRSATGDPAGALAHHEQALTLATALGQPVDRARALHGLAVARRALGDDDLARTYWRQALDLFEGLRISEVEELHVDDVRAALAVTGLP